MLKSTCVDPINSKFKAFFSFLILSSDFSVCCLLLPVDTTPWPSNLSKKYVTIIFWSFIITIFVLNFFYIVGP